MVGELHVFIERYAEGYRQRYIALQRAEWEAYTDGTPEKLERQAKTKRALIEFLSVPEAFAELKRGDQSAPQDPLLRRQVRLLRNQAERYQMDPDSIAQITELNQQLNRTFLNFRAQLGGERVGDNALKQILRLETDSTRRRQAWEASKQVGVEVASTIRELVRTRNRAARSLGYADYRTMSLALDEIDGSELEAVIDGLYRSTQSSYALAKAELDRRLGARFGVEPEALRPWHYSDPFFQEAPQVFEYDLDRYFASAQPQDFAVRTFDSLGLDVRDVLDRSDLFERQGKYQHAACFNLDREGDVRVIANLGGDYESATTMLHELGHAVYSKYVNPELPWLLRTYNHLITTEAMAILCGRFPSDAGWLGDVMGIPQPELDRTLEAVGAHRRLEQMVVSRWMSVVVEFERELYRDPEQDLNSLWWDLVERYQRVSRPEGREAPDWASKIHISLYPVYYQNYLLGQLMSHQWEAELIRRFGSVAGNRQAGDWLRAQIIQPGNQQEWNAALERATGERLNPAHFAARI